MSARRLRALCLKEAYQIIRDPSSILVAFVMPVVLLFVFGYAINLDSSSLRLGLVMEDQGPAAVQFEQTLKASGNFVVEAGPSKAALLERMAHGRLRGVVVVRGDFGARLAQGQGGAAIQVLTDGSEPNTASFVGSYVEGLWQTWQQQRGQNLARHERPMIEVQSRAWFNPSTVSRNFLVPGSIAVVMTIIGALLTSLVVAREWERGTMEALLATPVTKAEMLLSKILPYYALGMVAMALCLLVAVVLMDVPFRGSLLALFVLSSLFLGCALGNGLFLSTVMKNQFNAASAALVSAFLPSMMLSGFVFEISSMPTALRALTYLIPARYFAGSLQTLFQAGTLVPLLAANALGLALLTVLWLGLTAMKTGRTLE
ncbi:MAG: ABC transporter permease [Holophagaceae bacterium]|uniref:ABC transporter permease n=1 Tax=Candidatus Geothrix skivensis TaxID=2954439 RepID=A0A9D7XKS6_9BACT|nr:ABC transporter permease [Candidatus Geothrix skivensis]